MEQENKAATALVSGDVTTASSKWLLAANWVGVMATVVIGAEINHRLATWLVFGFVMLMAKSILSAIESSNQMKQRDRRHLKSYGPLYEERRDI